MANQSLEDIANQFEAALQETTGTSVPVGTVSPVGPVSAAGKKKHSFPEVVEMIRTNTRPTGGIPDVPGGYLASDFYRAGVTSGLLPRGAATFRSPIPFGSISERHQLAAGQAFSSSSAQTQPSSADSQSAINSQRNYRYRQEPDRGWTEGNGGWIDPPAPVTIPGSPNALGAAALVVPGGLGFTVASGLMNAIRGEGKNFIDFRNRSPEWLAADRRDGTITEKMDDLINNHGYNTFVLGEDGIVADPHTGREPDIGLLSSSNRHIESWLSGEFNPTRSYTWDLQGRDRDSRLGREIGTERETTDVNEFTGTFIEFLQKEQEKAEEKKEPGIFNSVVEFFSPKNERETEIQPAETWHPGVGGGDQSSDPTQSYGAPSQWGTWEDESYDYGETEVSEGISPAPGAPEAWYASGGQIGMQEGGMAPPMSMQQPPQEGTPVEGDMANLGMINEQGAAPPQEGGQQSVEDDVPREADEGDYILPYETVLLVGLKQLNRYAREAIDLAMKNDIDLTGTDLDPTDDVPIKVSNYEYHIPKALVPFFGGGKKYLDKIRDEGLSLRKRLEEEKQPSAQQQQPMPTEKPAPPQMEQAAPPPQMAPAPPPPQMAQAGPAPMMQKGGFVLDPKEKDVPTTESVLEADVSQPSTYNQLQTIERSRKQQQQPPMVDPTGKITQQGFAAPQGYQEGSMVEDPELALAAEPKTEPPLPDWANRALDPKTPVLMNEETGEPQTLGLITDNINNMFHVYPTIRMVGKKLERYDQNKALSITMKKKDSVKFKTQDEANSWSNNLVEQVTSLRDLQQPPQSDLIEPTVIPTEPPVPEAPTFLPPEGEGIAEEAVLPSLPAERQPGFAQQPMIA